MMGGDDFYIVEYLHVLAGRGRLVLSDEFYDGGTNKRIDEWCVTVVDNKSGKVILAHNVDLFECLHEAMTELEK